jgi:isocitrate/isopropylmalate dehydrogenase
VRPREEFGLYANLRPVKTMVPGGRYEDIDLVLIRENSRRFFGFINFARVPNYAGSS